MQVKSTQAIESLVYMVDLGDSVAFLSMEDIAALGRDSSKWPRVRKAVDQREIGLLLSGRSIIPDRFSAAKAYAAMLRVGESKAALCAGRWLGRDAQSAGYEYEKEIREALRRVSEIDESKVENTDRPIFCTQPGIMCSEREVQMWSFGCRKGTTSALKVLVNACREGGEGWVPVCTGGRSLGFEDGDYDFLLYCTSAGSKSTKTARLLTELSREDRARLQVMSAGDLLTIPDAWVGSSTTSLSVVMSKDGERGYHKVIRQGLFFEYILSDADMRELFGAVRRRAKACKAIDAHGGMLNTWSVMITCLEWLALNDYLGINTSTPLASQRPVITGLAGTTVGAAARDYFLWMRTSLQRTDHVFGSFCETGRWIRRGTSEFAQAANTRVCRDPFSQVVENSMRSVTQKGLAQLVPRMKHAAFCTSRVDHTWTDAPLLVRPNLGVPGMIEKLFDESAGGNTAVEITVRDGVYIAVGMPTGSVGISDNEMDARIRACVNSGRRVSDRVSLIYGPAMQAELGEGVTMRKLMDYVSCLYYSEITDEGTWVVGFCSCEDIRDGLTMSAMPRDLVEATLMIVYQEAERWVETEGKK